MLFHSHTNNDGYVPAPEFEYHLCIVLNRQGSKDAKKNNVTEVEMNKH